MILDVIPCGPLGANTYFFGRRGGDSVAVVDAADAAVVEHYLKEKQKRLACVLFTHGHFDHIAGAYGIGQQTEAELMIHGADAKALESDRESLADMAGIHLPPQRAGRVLSDGDRIEAAGIPLRVLHTPGHSKGSVCYVCDEHRFAFTGDTVFLESVGRTDLPGGNLKELFDSVMHRVLALPQEYVLYPGHGEETTVEHECRNNPLIRYRGHAWFN